MDSPTDKIINHQTEVSKQLTSNEVMLRDILIAHLRNSGIDVITDRAVGQRILDDCQYGIGNSDVRFQSAFHGSGISFDHFDTIHHLSEGEGNQVFGVGTYVSQVRKVAENYANIASLKGNRYSAVVDGVSFNYNDPKQASMFVFLACDKVAKYGREEAIKSLTQNISDYVKLGWSEKEAEARKALDYLNSHDIHASERGRYLYTVDIPDDDGNNYLQWDIAMRKKDCERIYNGFFQSPFSAPLVDGVYNKYNDRYKAIEADPSITNKDSALYYDKELILLERKKNQIRRVSSIASERLTFEDFYGRLAEFFESDVKASEFLSSLGYKGIKVHTDFYGFDPDRQRDWNYIVFNSSDIKIKDKIKFFKAANGDAYGFTVNDKIYVDPEIANSETPIHEYAHMWAAGLRAGNKQEWANVVNLMKSQTELWDSVRARYPQLTTDDDIADEVLATYSGKRGSERLREQVSRVMGGDVESSNMFKAFEEAIKRFWHDVADLFHIHYDSAEQVADQVMSDMLHGMRSSVTEADGVKSSLTDEEADLDRRYAEAVASGNIKEARQLLVDRAKSKGYLPTDYQGKDSWSAPVAEVDLNDFENKKALQQMVDDFGTEPNIFGIINGIQAHDSDYYYNPDVAGFHGQAAEETAEVLRSLRDQRANGDTQVDIYRVVPNDVVGDQIMQGDWVALSKAYCDELGQHKYGEGNYHVIESRSAIKNLWMGSEDMREFGFDDGYGDVEKNVRNNRKLLDITYDDEGNLIPLSQRFNEGKEDVKFQLSDDNNLKKDSSQTHMDEKKEKSNEDHLSSYTKDVMKIFADRMVKMMQEMKASDYKQGWAVGSGRNMLPMNITGRTFDGLNILMANHDTYKNDYVSPIYMTGMQIVNHGWRIKEEEKAKALPILAYVPSYLYDGKFINQKKYDELSSEEKDKAKISFILRVYKEYNLDQTNVADVNPQLYAKLTSFGEDGRVAKDSEGMYVSPELDRMFNKQEWVCPIRYEKPSPEAFYSPSDDRIVVPMKQQYKISKTPEEVFKDGQAYYADVLHEMAHSTGHPSRLDRPFIQKAGDENYAREELVAELSSALVSSALGFDKRINKNSAAYLDGWVRHLSDNPTYIKNLMSPVKKASMMILENIDKQRIALGMEPLVRHGEVDLVKLVESQSVKQDDTLDKDAIADGYANNMEKQWDEVVKMFGQDENLFDQLTAAASGQPLDSVKHTDKFDIIHDFINQFGGKKELGADLEANSGVIYNSHTVSQLNLADGSVLEVNDYLKAVDDSVNDIQELSHVRDGAIIDSVRKEIGGVNQKVNQEALNNLWSAFVGSAPINRIHEKQIVNDKEKAVGQETLRTENRGKTKVISTGNYYNTETDRSAVFALHWMWSDLLNGRDVNNHLSDYVMSRQNFSHQIKAGNVSQIEPSMLMSHELLGNIGQGNQDKYVLVPIPEHTGKADYTLQLAEHIGVQTGIEVSDLLESKEHAEFYDIKKNRDANSIDPEKVDFGIKVKDGMQLPNGKIPILVDNVLDTGKTISDSAKALNTKEHMALVFANTDKWKEHPSYNIEVAPPAHYRESKDGKSINDIVTQVSRLVTVDDGNVKDSSRQRPRFVQAAVGVNYLNNIRENMGKAWFDDEKNWNKPVSRDNYLAVHAERVKSVADQGKLDLESEVRTLIDKYEDENAPRELFDYSNWSDEKLLAYMKLDGGGEFNHAMNVDVYEEYDARHDKEYDEAYDKAYNMHTLVNTSFSEAVRLLGEMTVHTDALTTPERTEHLAHQDALVDYIKDLNKGINVSRSVEVEHTNTVSPENVIGSAPSVEVDTIKANEDIQSKVNEQRQAADVDSMNVKEKASMSKDWYFPTPGLDGEVTDSLAKLEVNHDIKGMLDLAKEHDTFAGIPIPYMYTSKKPIHFEGDKFLGEDNDYALVSNHTAAGDMYLLYKRMSEDELLSHLKKDGYGKELLPENDHTVSKDVRQLVNQYVKSSQAQNKVNELATESMKSQKQVEDTQSLRYQDGKWLGVPADVAVSDLVSGSRHPLSFIKDNNRINLVNLHDDIAVARVYIFDKTWENADDIFKELKKEGFSREIKENEFSGGFADGYVDFDNFKEAAAFASHVEDIQKRIDAARRPDSLMSAFNHNEVTEVTDDVAKEFRNALLETVRRMKNVGYDDREIGIYLANTKDYWEDSSTMVSAIRDVGKDYIRDWYVSVNYLQNSEDTAVFEELESKDDYKGMLQEARNYDFSAENDWDLQSTFKDSPKHYTGDDFLDEDDDYAIVKNDSVGGTYTIFRRATESEVRDEAIRQGYGEEKIGDYGSDLSDDVKSLVNQMVDEKLSAKQRNAEQQSDSLKPVDGQSREVGHDEPESLSPSDEDKKQLDSPKEEIADVKPSAANKEQTYYAEVAAYMNSEDVQMFDEIKVNEKSLLSIASQCDPGDGIDQEYTYKSPYQSKGDKLIAEDDNYAVIFNDESGSNSYTVLRKVSESDVRLNIDRYGLSQEASDDVIEVAKKYEAEKVAHKVEAGEKPELVEDPMMKAFYQIKAERPNNLLLFQSEDGDFINSYKEDARKVSEILRLPLQESDTVKDRNGQFVDTCVFPKHTLSTYLPKLVRAGEKAIIVDNPIIHRDESQDKQKTPHEDSDMRTDVTDTAKQIVASDNVPMEQAEKEAKEIADEQVHKEFHQQQDKLHAEEEKQQQVEKQEQEKKRQEQEQTKKQKVMNPKLYDVFGMKDGQQEVIKAGLSIVAAATFVERNDERYQRKGYDYLISMPHVEETLEKSQLKDEDMAKEQSPQEQEGKERKNPYQPLFEGSREEAQQIVDALKEYLENPDNTIPYDEILRDATLYGETPLYADKEWYKKYAEGKSDPEIAGLYRRALATLETIPEQQATVKSISDNIVENNQEQEDMNNKEEQLEHQAKKEEELHKEESSKSEPVTPKVSSDDSAKEKAEQTKEPSSKEDEKVVNTAAVHAGLLLGALESAKEGIWLNPHGKHGAALLEPGKMITGYNRLMMDLCADKNHYKTNVFTYYDYAKKEEMPVKQGQTSLPIDWTRWDYENVATKEVITKEQYAELTPDKQQDYARHSTKQTRHLYNIDQTAMAGTKVADYSKLVKDNGSKFEDIPELPTDKNFLNLTNRLHGKHKDCTIILGEGDKNFAYGKHAEKVGSVMGVPVQSKDIDGKKVSYIEFPHTALDTVLPKMIGSHNKVALCSNVLESKFEASNNISKNSVRDAATVADKVSRKAGFTLERVLDDVPVSYDKEKDIITYSGNNARQPGRENLAAVEKANDIYRAVVEATGRENRLDRVARFNMLPEDNAKYEKLVQELSAGVLMASHGLPAIISKENRVLIPYWEREIKENPKMMAVLEKDVNNSIEQIEKHLLGQEVDYAKVRGARPALFDAKDYTVASKMAQLPNVETKEFVVIRNAEKTAADVILPEGAALPGMNKDRITHALAKENIKEVHFYNAGGAQGLYKDNDYFAGKTATLTKLKQWELLPRHVVDISSQYLNVEKKPLIERFRAIPDDSHRWAFNIKAKGEGQFSVYPAKEYLNAYFTARNNPNKVEKAKMMSSLAQRYYAVAQAHPEVKKELIMPKVPEGVDMSKLTGTTIGRDKDDHSKVFVQSTIDGAFHKEPITMAQYQRMWLADDMQDYKNAIAANAFASIIKSAKAQQEADEGLKIVDNSNVKDVVGHSEKQDQGHSESHSDGGSSDSDDKSESEGQGVGDASSKQADKDKSEEENKSRGFHM